MKLFSRFIISGIINTVLGYIVIINLIYFFNNSPIFNNICGYSIGLTSSYLLNKFYTFKSNKKSSREVIKFIIVFIISYAINLICLTFLIENVALDELTAQVLSSLIYTFTSYFLNKYYVFNS